MSIPIPAAQKPIQLYCGQNVASAQSRTTCSHQWTLKCRTGSIETSR